MNTRHDILPARLVLAATLLTAGCASFEPTPYQPSVDGGYGYSDEQVGNSEYRITVAGNAATSAETLWNQLLLRAAEITLAADQKYFVVAPTANGQLATIKPAFLMPQFGLGPGGFTGVRMPLLQYQGLPVGVEPSREMIASLSIAVGVGRRAGASNVFDARAIKQRQAPEPGVLRPSK
ncbi:MAG: CC0125/CC1285 family lipoprotein [Gammaproteobacteria bacterium]